MQTLVLKFRIKGNLRYLSHHETMAMFRRALSRAGISLCYSHGYNPRPRLSLPLPRPVGVESDDELLCGLLNSETGDSEAFCQDRIAAQLPEDCELISVSVAMEKVTFQPEWVLYEFPLASLARNEKIKLRLAELGRDIAAGPVMVRRRATDKEPARDIDVKDYIDSVDCLKDSLIVKCNVTNSGTIRIDEIYQLLNIDASELAGPVKRISVHWKTTGKLFTNN